MINPNTPPSGSGGIARSRQAQLGFCACGCGIKVGRYKETDRRRGYVKGQLMRFVTGHHHRIYRPNAWNSHDPSWYRERDRRMA